MTCLVDETVLAFVRGGLTDEAFRDVEAHLSQCPDCCALVAEAAQVVRPDSVGATDRPALLAPGAQVSRYVIEEALGAGAAGVVYRAYDNELRRNVALKILRSDTQDARTRSLREAQTLARLSHPHVVNVYDLGTHEDQVFIVIELVDGQNVAQWLRAQPRPWRAVLDVFAQAGRGLAAAHAAGLIHRDFKPENVLIGADGRARVADFGLARALNPTPAEPATEPATGAIVGTPGYMAPELLRGGVADPRSDQYSFCVALWASLFGGKPFGPGGEPVAPPADAPVPRAVVEALRRGLSAPPADRFATMDELLAALQPAMAPARPAGARRPWLVAGAALLVVGIVALARTGVRRAGSGTGGACLTDVALGYNHACGLDRDGTVWCWGKVGFDGPVGGDNEPESRLVPLQIRDGQGRVLDRIADLTGRYTTTCARERQGLLWCWGAPSYGKLGDGRDVRGPRTAIATQVRSRSAPSGHIARVARVAVGSHHTCAVEEHGRTLCWGSNEQGQLGLREPDRDRELLPRILSHGAAPYARIAAGAHHTCATRTDGTLWCWGDNRNGQLGAATDPDRRSQRPLAVQGPDGTPLADVIDLSMGHQHSCVATKDGQVHCWGENRHGQLGAGDRQRSAAPRPAVAAPDDRALTGAIAVRAGDAFTCALRGDGTVWCFGDNGFGQLGAGAVIETSSRALAVLTAPGGPPLAGVVKLAAGSFSACALRRDGGLWCWGRNNGAQLGVGDTRDRNVAVQARPPCP